MNTIRRALTTLIVLLLASAAITQDFRSFSWGDSSGYVKSIERTKLQDEFTSASGDITYSIQLPIGEADLYYQFSDDQLHAAEYHYTLNYDSEASYLRAYHRTKNDLTMEYGEPDADVEVWYNDQYIDDPDNYIAAISLGHLTLMTMWTAGNTIISHQLTGNHYLTGDNYDFALGTSFEDFERVVEEEEEEDTEYIRNFMEGDPDALDKFVEEGASHGVLVRPQ